MNLEEDIIAYVLDELPADRKQLLEQYLDNNPEAAESVELYNSLLNTLNQTDTEQPSDQLQKRFNGFLEKEIYRLEKKHIKDNIRRINWKWLPIAASILLLGMWIGQRFLSRPSVADNASITADKAVQISMTKLVSNPSASYRIRGVNMAYDLPDLDAAFRQTLETVLFYDESPNVRLAAAEVLSAYSDDALVRDILLRALIEVNEPIVRINIITYLSGIGELRAIPEFNNLLAEEDLPKAVKDELYAGLLKLM